MTEKNNVANNKKAWEYSVYEWRMMHQGKPEELAKKICKNPNIYLRYHTDLFIDIKNKTIASICGSDGQRAVALALKGGLVTVFDLSENQKKYALDLAKAAFVEINYDVGDFCSLDEHKYKSFFDYAYCEGGILHYFLDLNLFFKTVAKILKPNGTFICSDYHPFQKAIVANPKKRNVDQCDGNYFDKNIYSGHVPYAKYFDDDSAFPPCILRFYTLSEIFSAAINAGLSVEGFREHPKVDGGKIPFEFTLILKKI